MASQGEADVPYGETPLASRVFSWAEQLRFADLSGDRNPIHIDKEAARRTITGGLVVHGVHLLLWALGALADCRASLPPVRRIHARFLRFTYLDEEVSAVLLRQDEREWRIAIRGGATVRADLRIFLGDGGEPPPIADPASQSDRVFPLSATPIDRSETSIDGLAGLVAPIADPGPLLEWFGSAAALIGGLPVEGLVAASRLVGMICPGLHSVLTAIDVHPDPAQPSRELACRMGELRHGMIPARIAGAGLTGTVQCLVPAAPVRQPPFASFGQMVAPDRFVGSTALVIGGSRGLGEVVAKLVAAGGGVVLLGYHQGVGDADAIASDINRSGGRCSPLLLDVTRPIAPQWSQDLPAPSHIYYFATPMIASANTVPLSRSRLEQMQEYYLHGFWAAVHYFETLHPGASYFYPLPEKGDWEAGLPEFALAKAGGEALCASIARRLPDTRLSAVHLPWITTDQTNRIRAVDATSDMKPLFEAVFRFQDNHRTTAE